MLLINQILVITGLIPVVIGLITFFHPSFARFINAPGTPQLKALISIIVGIILILVGLMIEIPIE